MIGLYLAKAAIDDPERPFLISGSTRLSYAAATRMVALLAHALSSRGITRFLVYAHDCPELILLLIAGSVEGAQTCVANRRNTTEELGRLCRRLDFAHVITDTSLNLPGIKCDNLKELLGSSQSEPAASLQFALADDPNARHLVLTTGTTGEPKAATYTWTDLASQIRQRPDYRESTFLLAYQLNHFAGIQMMLHALCNGATLVIPDSLQVSDVVQAVKMFGVDSISATPTFWRMLCSYLLANPRERFPLRQITAGGEAVTEDVISKLQSCFPGVPISQVYASTEVGSVFSVRDGKPGFPASLLDREDREVELRIVDGELHIRSQRSMLGYLGQAGPRKGEWIPTGDLVAIQGDRVVFLGRKMEVINVGGAKVHPIEIEELIRKVPGVSDVRVLGRPSPVTGQIVAAQIVLVPGFRRENVEPEVRTTCRLLDRYKRPRLIEFVDDLPMANQKLLRRAEGNQ